MTKEILVVDDNLDMRKLISGINNNNVVVLAIRLEINTYMI